MPFQKGTSGNKTAVFSADNQPQNRGRKNFDLQAHVSNILAEKNSRGATVLDGILRRLASQALNGNLKAADMLLAYAYGKPKQQVDHTTSGNEITAPATIVFIR
jgi:hypothetical protein